MIFVRSYSVNFDRKIDFFILICYNKDGIHWVAPELPSETNICFRTHVIFPGGMILEPNGEVKIYYGAADTVECLATAHVDDLIALCLSEN